MSVRSQSIAPAIAGAAVALVLGLGLLPADAFAAKAHARAATKSKKSAAAQSDPVLVRVGGDAITRSEVQKRIETLPEQFRSNYSTPEGRQQLLDRMVEERVWLQLATRNGVADRPQVRQQLDQQRRDLIVRTYLNEVMATNPAPSDSEAQAWYNEHLADYRTPPPPRCGTSRPGPKPKASGSGNGRRASRTGTAW